MRWIMFSIGIVLFGFTLFVMLTNKCDIEGAYGCGTIGLSIGWSSTMKWLAMGLGLTGLVLIGLGGMEEVKEESLDYHIGQEQK